MGDVHPQGNPHYWLDPANGRRIAQAVQARLAQLSPGDTAYFAQRYADFDRRLAEGEKRWKAAMAPYKGLKVVTYHRSWPNFAEAFGLDVIGYVEPKPGIPPSPGHTLDLQQEMKRQNVKIILVEPYFDLKTPNAIGRDTGAKVLVMLPSVGGRSADHRLLEALRLRHRPARVRDQRGRGPVDGRPDAHADSRLPGGALCRQPHPHGDPRLSGRARRRAGRHLRRSLARANRRARRHDRDPAADVRRRSARALGLLGQPRVHVHRRGDLLDDSRKAGADPAGSDHRHHLRRGLGRGDPRDEQVHLRRRASQAHAGRQHHRGLLGRGRQDRRALRRRRHVPLRLPEAVPHASR